MALPSNLGFFGQGIISVEQALADNIAIKATTLVRHDRVFEKTAQIAFSESVNESIVLRLPGDVTDLVATPQCGGVVNLAWTDVLGETSYQRYFKISTDISFIAFGAPLGAGVTTSSVTGLTAGVTYDFQVRGVNATGEGSSNTPQTSPLSVPTTPNTPSAALNGANSVSVPLGGSVGAVTFDVQRKRDGTLPTGFAVIATGQPAGTFFDNGFPTSDPSWDGITGTPGVIAVTGNDATSITLSFPSDPDQGDDIIIFRAVGAGSFSQLTTRSPGTTVFTDTGLTDNTLYKYKILYRGLNPFGGYRYRAIGVSACGSSAPSGQSIELMVVQESTFSNEVAQLTDIITIPIAPTGGDVVDLTIGMSGRIGVSWVDNADDEDGFRVTRSADGGGFSLVQTLGANIEEWDDTTVTLGVEYVYRIVAFNAAGDSTATTTPPITPFAF